MTIDSLRRKPNCGERFRARHNDEMGCASLARLAAAT
jgi:hypothetical protein